MKELLFDRKHTQSPDAKHQVFVSSMLVLLGGLAIGLSHVPLPLWWLAWIALVPLLLLWDRTEPFKTQKLVQFTAEIYTAFLIAYAVAFFWPLLHTFSKLHVLGKTTLLAFGSLLLVPAVFTFPFVASLPYRRKRGRLVGFAVFTVFYLAVELVFEYIAFPWPVLGYTQAAAVPINQFAEVTGVAGLSLWVLLLNGLAFGYYTAKRMKVRIQVSLTAILLIIFAVGGSLWRTSKLGQTNNFVTVGLVQPAMDNAAWTERFGGPRVSRMIALSDSLIASMNAPPIFMIWPEMALPAPASESRHQFVNEQLQAWTEQQEVALLTGALVPENVASRSGRFYNRALLFRPYSETQQYDQVYLLPYQPHVPVAKQSPWLPPPLRSRFIRGAYQRPLSFDGIRIGVLMGFELLLSDYVRRYPRQQADFLTVLTLDGWWGDTPGYRQHLNYLRLRAIETRRSIVQVAASGSTALLAPDGSIIFRSEAHKATARLAAVPIYRDHTFYARFGNWIGWMALVLSLTLIGWTFIVTGWRYWQALDAPENIKALPG